MLTERIIRDAKPEPKARVLWDAAVKGLGVKVFPSGQKSFVVSYRVGGRKRLATIARCAEVSLKTARKRAGDELLGIRAGESDPLERQRDARNAPTVEEGIDRFFAETVPERLRIGKLKPKTVHEYRLQSNTIRDAIGKRRIEDVSYVLKSDRTDLGADEAWRIYHLLTRAENAFRCMKSPLAERPIFHQVQRRVETRIFLCVLAYHLLVAIEKTLLDQGVHTSWASVRDALATHAIVTIVLPTDSGATMRIRKASTAESEHRELYRLLGVDEKIMSPKTIWSEIADHE